MKWTIVNMKVVTEIQLENGKKLEVVTEVVSEGMGWMNDRPEWGQAVFDQVSEDCGNIGREEN
jgi:hypothetical protein